MKTHKATQLANEDQRGVFYNLTKIECIECKQSAKDFPQIIHNKSCSKKKLWDCLLCSNRKENCKCDDFKEVDKAFDKEFESVYIDWMGGELIGELPHRVLIAREEIKEFLHKTLSAEITKALENCKQLPMGISQWQNHGAKYGYDKFFEEKARTTEKEKARKEETEECPSLEEIIAHGNKRFLDGIKDERKKIAQENIERLEREMEDSHFGCITHRALDGQKCIVCKKANNRNNAQNDYNQSKQKEIDYWTKFLEK